LSVVVVKGLAAGTPRLVSGWLDRVPRASGRYLGR
jgi:hypothetical protein